MTSRITEMTTYPKGECHFSYLDRCIEHKDQLFFKTLWGLLEKYLPPTGLPSIVIEYLDRKWDPQARIGISLNLLRSHTIQLTQVLDVLVNTEYFKIEIGEFSCLFRIKEFPEPTGTFRLQFGKTDHIESFGIIAEYTRTHPQYLLKKNQRPFYLKYETKREHTYVALARKRFYTFSRVQYSDTATLKISVFTDSKSAFNNRACGSATLYWGNQQTALPPEHQTEEHMQFLLAQRPSAKIRMEMENAI